MAPSPLSALGLAAAVALFAGCASSQPTGGEASAARVCVKVREINSFTALDDRHVLVKASVSDHSLLTVDKACVGLSFARAIAIEGAPTRVCSDGFDFLSFHHPGAGLKRCRIVNIEPVADETAARALIDSRPAE